MPVSSALLLCFAFLPSNLSHKSNPTHNQPLLLLLPKRQKLPGTSNQRKRLQLPLARQPWRHLHDGTPPPCCCCLSSSSPSSSPTRRKRRRPPEAKPTSMTRNTTSWTRRR